MIKPFSGGFDMKSICRKCDGLEECIKELEQELERYKVENAVLERLRKELIKEVKRLKEFEETK